MKRAEQAAACGVGCKGLSDVEASFLKLTALCKDDLVYERGAFMRNQVVDTILTPWAVLGTNNNKFTVQALPQALQPAAQQIEASLSSPEDCFYKVTALSIAYDQSLVHLEQNSFSIEQMAKLSEEQARRQAQVQSQAQNQAQSQSEPESQQDNQSKPEPQQAKQEPAKQESSKQEQTPSLSEDIGPLWAKLQMHVGPIPLSELTVPLQEQVLPDEVSSLLQLVKSTAPEALLLWTLRKMGRCPYVLKPEHMLRWVVDFTSNSNFNLRMDEKSASFSTLMLREFIARLGGARFKFMLPYITPNGFESVFLQPQWQFDEKTGEFEPEWIMANGSDFEAIGLMVKLRWLQPELARELLGKYFKRFEGKTRDELVLRLNINLSAADEPFLMQTMLNDRSKAVRDRAWIVLCDIPDSQYAAQCASLCRKYLRYDPNQGWKAELITYGPEFKALGVADPKVKAPTLATSYDMLRRLMWAMSWEDIKALVGQTDPVKVMEVFSSNHSSKCGLFNVHSLDLQGWLTGKITQAQDAAAAEAFMNNNKLFVANSYYTVVPLVQLLEPTKRREFLFRQTNMNEPNPIYFYPPESQCLPMDFMPLSEEWAQALLDHTLEETQYTVSRETIDRFIMTLPYSFIDSLAPLLEQKRKQLSEAEQTLEKISEDSKVSRSPQTSQNFYTASRSKQALDAVCNFLDKVLTGLTLKRQVETVLQKELPEFYVADLTATHAAVKRPLPWAK